MENRDIKVGTYLIIVVLKVFIKPEEANVSTVLLKKIGHSQ